MYVKLLVLYYYYYYFFFSKLNTQFLSYFTYLQKNFVIGPKAIILSSSLASCSTLEYLSNGLFSSTMKHNNIVVAYESIPVQHTIVS